MRKLVGSLADNAMLYKDITQWLRNKTFVSLFFGLLFVAEIISVVVISLGEDVTKPGPVVFYSLYVVLILYGFIIAFQGHGLTAREFANKTFELYELSGMSLERMISGKILSLLNQFLFGFFCIVPFMFFAYFLGGLDFFELFSGVVLTLLFIVPLYMVTLLVALSSKLKQVNTLGKFVAGAGIGVFMLMGVFSLFGSRSPVAMLFTETSRMLKGLVEFNPDSFVILIAFVVFYSQICLLLFYLCCNTISRETDSRETEVKLVCFTLTLSWFGMISYVALVKGYDKGLANGVCIPVLLLITVLGVMMYYNRMEVPAIVKNRYRRRGKYLALIYSIFKPGAQGAFHTILLLMAMTLAFGVVMATLAMCAPTLFASATDTSTAARDWFDQLSTVIQIPFFLVFPLGFLWSLKDMRTNYVLQRTTMALWWAITGAMFSFLVAWTRTNNNAMEPLYEFLAIVLSPFASAFVEFHQLSLIHDIAPYFRTVLGACGIWMMSQNLNRRRKEAAPDKYELRITNEV